MRPNLQLKPGPKVRHGVRERLLTFITALVILSCAVGAFALLRDERWFDAGFNFMLAGFALVGRWMDRNRNWVSLSNDEQTLTIRTWTGCRQVDLHNLFWHLHVPIGREAFLRPAWVEVGDNQLRLTPLHQRWDTWGPAGEAAEWVRQRLDWLQPPVL